MPKGGKRVGAGRPKGSRNTKTKKQIEAVVKGGITPLDYMLKTLRDETRSHEERIDAANKAAPYVHPKLASIDHQSSDGSMSEMPTTINLVAPKPDGS